MLKKGIRLRPLAIACICAMAFSAATPSYAFLGGRGGGDRARESTQLASWAAQYVQKIQELKQLKEHYESVHGARMMADLVNNPEIRKYLPADFRNLWEKSYEDSDAILAILKALPEFNANQLEEKRLKQMAVNDALINKAYQEASRRFEDIQVLLDKINEMEDDKEIQDLAARIQAESVMIQNEQAKITMLIQQMEIQDRKMTHQISQRMKESMRTDKEGSVFYGREIPQPYQR